MKLLVPLCILALVLAACERAQEPGALRNAVNDAGSFTLNTAAGAVGHCTRFSKGVEISGANLQGTGPIIESMGKGLPGNVPCDLSQTSEPKAWRPQRRPTAAQIREGAEEAAKAAARASPRM